MKGQITPHFSWEEAVCSCGCAMPKAVREQVVLAAVMVEQVRAALGGRPMKVLSWYRCPKWNARVGGVPNSQHLLGRAIDFVVRGLSPEKTQAEIVLLNLYPGTVRGLGKYAGFTHIDRRTGPAVSWTEKTRSAKA